ncbi:TonB-dependent receptor domain-containing protein [Vibrio fluminensis]|uniref:TonB-dependent receptor domain-containing protein n=1 Tax=Vibrio fluminensis TaxID=2783614 RepID=UPI001889814E|nr:TonB-dependent receptor [Vibrio fluminensis]
MDMFKRPTTLVAALGVVVAPTFAQDSSVDVSEVMVVTATKSEVSLQDAPASLTVVTEEDLNRLPATDITTALESVAGVRIARTTGSEPKIIIRGLKNQYSSNDNFALVLVNGRRISSSETVIRGAGFDLSSIPMSAIERVEVIRGPMSALYGSEAIGGVVNIILKKPTNETQGNVSFTYSKPKDDNPVDAAPKADGGFNNFRGFVSGAVVEDKLLYTAAVDVSQRDEWFPDNATDNFNPTSEQERTSLNTSLTWLASDSTNVILDLGYIDDQRVDLAISRGSLVESNYDTSKFTAGLALENEWSWGDSDLRYFYERSFVDEDHWHPAVGMAQIEQKNHSLDGNVSFELAEIHYLTTGFDLSYSTLENDRDYVSKPSARQSAVYIQDEITLTDDLALTLSGRFTHHDQFGSDISPRAYLVFNATESLTFKGGYGEGFKAPTMFQSDENFRLISCGGSCYLVGNPDLKPQSSKTYEFSTLYHQPSWFVQGTVFFNQVNDLIDRDTTTSVGTAPDGKPLIQYVNYDSVETRGIELESEFDITDTVFLAANATYIDTEDKTTGEELTYSPDWLANATVTWTPSYNWNLFAGVNYVGKQVNSDDKQLSGYEVVDVGAGYQVSDALSVSFGITNLLDERLDESEDEYEEQEFGRTYYLKLDVDF